MGSDNFIQNPKAVYEMAPYSLHSALKRGNVYAYFRNIFLFCEKNVMETQLMSA